MNDIWWKQVTNAVRYIYDVKDALLNEKCVLIHHSSEIPWYDDFTYSVIDAVSQQNGEKKFEDIPLVDNPGKYLLEKFCKAEIRAAFRPGKGYAKFFAETEEIVLHDRYIWVKISDTTSLQKWLDLVSEYLKERKDKKHAVFILELNGNDTVSSKKGIKAFKFSDYIEDYDRIVFSVLAVSEIKDSAAIKSYLAELASNILGNDIELCAECVAQYESFMNSPIDTIKKIIEEKIRSDGTNYIYNKSADEVNYLIWRSQIKTIYPSIEEYREKFVEKYKNEIKKNLPIKSTCGEEYNDPKEVEIGTLKYLADFKLIQISPSEHELLIRYKDARDKLSHLSVLNLSEIRSLF